MDQTNANNSTMTSVSSMVENVNEELMTKMKTRRTSIVPGQRVGATTKAHKQDINPQTMGCMRWWVEDDRTVDGTTGNGAATGLPQRMTPRGFGGRRAADVIDAGVTREQALTQVFSGKGKPRVSMMLLLPSKQPLPIVTSCDVHKPSFTLELPS